MGDYQRTGPNGMVCTIGNGSDAAFIALGKADAVMRPAVEIPDDERQAAAQALAGDGHRVMPADEWASIEDARKDLRRILAELGLGTHARSDSPHQVVMREVLPRIRELRAAEPDRPEPVDPSAVRVGDVVEVEAADGSWMVRGEVGSVDSLSSYPLAVPVPSIGGSVLWPRLTDATVRVLRRAEPDQLAAIRRHVDRLEQYLRDRYYNENTRLGGIVADLRRAVDGGPDDE